MIFKPSLKCVPNDILTQYTNWFRFLKGFIADSHYDSDNLEEVLKKAMNPHCRMFDMSISNSIDCRITIVISRVSDGRVCVWANYCGTSWQNTKAAYIFLIFQMESQNLLLYNVWVIPDYLVCWSWEFERLGLTITTVVHNILLLLCCK